MSVLKKEDLETDYYSVSFYDTFSKKTYSGEDKKQYQVGVHLDKVQRPHHHIYPTDEAWKEMDKFISTNKLEPRDAMYIRQGLCYDMTIKECYEFFVDRTKQEHPERLRLRLLGVDNISV